MRNAKFYEYIAQPEMLFRDQVKSQAHSREHVNQGKGVPQTVHPITPRLHWDERRTHVLPFPGGAPVLQVHPSPARGQHLEMGSKQVDTVSQRIDFDGIMDQLGCEALYLAALFITSSQSSNILFVVSSWIPSEQ